MSVSEFAGKIAHNSWRNSPRQVKCYLVATKVRRVIERELTGL